MKGTAGEVRERLVEVADDERQEAVPPELPTAAWINQPADTKEVAAHQIRTRSVSPGLTGSAHLAYLREQGKPTPEPHTDAGRVAA